MTPLCVECPAFQVREMVDNLTDSVTRLLERAQSGDDAAVELLLPVLYSELRALAGSFLNEERPGHTLQPTALVHEVYLRLIKQPEGGWADRTHFVALAATAMRRILTDHARGRRAAKRGGNWHRVTLDQAVAPFQDAEIDAIDLDAALTKLSAFDERKCRVVELRFFGGLTNEEVAKVLGVSRKTIVDDWTVARLWLRRELSSGKSA